MTVRIPDLLQVIVTNTEAEAAAKATIARTRAVLEAEARARLAAEGAAPSWSTKGLGKVRYDDAGEWTATVADETALGSWVAEHYPTEATAVVTLDATDLEAALEALTFAGITPAEARVALRPTFAAQLAENRLPDRDVVVDVEETASDDGGVDRVINITAVHQTTGDVVEVPGMSATRKPGRLVVTLDRERRASALAAAAEATDAIIAAATEDADAVVLDPRAVDARRRVLETLPLPDLKSACLRQELGTSGTKAQLAERLARAQLTYEAEAGVAIEHAANNATSAEEADAILARTHPELVPTPGLIDAATARARLLAAAGGALTTASALPAPTRAVALQERTPTMVTAHLAPELTDEEAATVARFEAAPAAFPDDATSAAGDALLAPGDIHPDALQVRALIALTGDQLKRACRAKGLPIAGSKATLAERLHAAGVTADTLA